MAKKTIDVGVVLSADNKAYKKGMSDAAKASREMERAAKDSAKQAKQQFEAVTMALAKVAGAAALAKGAFDVYAKVMNSTEGTADKFEQQMATLHGTLQGLMMTVATGSWDNLVSNIKNTAKATRELTAALDAYEDSKAGTSVRRGRVSFNLQEARVSAAEATDPAEKANFLQQAIDYQRELTAIEVDEIKKRLVISEDYYKTVTGHSKEYFDYFLSMVPKLANNYDYYFGPNSVMMEGTKARLGQLDYRSQLGPLSKAQEKERHELELLKLTMEDFILVRDSFSKPGQFNEYIKGLGELEMASAEGEKALVRLAKQLQTALAAANKIDRIKGPDKIYIPLNGLFPGDPNALRPDMTRDASKQFKNQLQLVNDLEGAFVDMFTSISSGSGTAFEDMAKAFTRALEQMAAQFAAKAVMFGILTLLSGGAGALAGFAKAALGTQSFGQFTGLGQGLSYSSPSIPSNPININVTGKISGRDIHLSNSRYMQMMTSTT